jgi:hypothetical protein
MGLVFVRSEAKGSKAGASEAQKPEPQRLRSRSLMEAQKKIQYEE